MIEGIIIFVLGFLCGSYKNEIRTFVNDQIEKIFKKNENDNDMI